MSKNMNRVIFTCGKAQAERLEKYQEQIGWAGSRGALIRMMLDKVMDMEGVEKHDGGGECDEDEREDEAADAL